MNRLKWKERLGIFSLAVALSLVLFAIISLFSHAFSRIFFSFLVEEKKSAIIWVENLVENDKS